MFVTNAISNKETFWGKCAGDIDEPVDDVFAWMWMGCSYERMKLHREKHGDLLRQSDASEVSRNQIFQTEQKLAPGFANRWYEVESTWVKLQDNGSIVQAFRPTVKGDTGLFTPGSLGAFHTGMYHFEQVAPRITRFTLVQKTICVGIAQWFLKMLVKTAFSVVLRVQDKFRRVDSVIDKEIRNVLAARIRDSEPSEQDVFESCGFIKKNFDQGAQKNLVKALPPASPHVAYYCGTLESKGQTGASARRAACGKAVGVIDTSADDAAAWTFEFCSRARVRTHNEFNADMPRFISRRTGSDSFVSGLLVRLPFPFWPREFVVGVSWSKRENGAISVFINSVDEDVDYGMSTGWTVRASTTAVSDIVPNNGPNSCTITFHQQVDSRGFIPVAVVNSKVTYSLSIVDDMREVFQRDEEIDVESRRALFATLKAHEDVGNALSQDEKVVFDVIVASVQTDTAALKQTVEGVSDHLIEIYRLPHPKVSDPVARTKTMLLRPTSFAHHRQRSPVYALEVTVDADIIECVAWNLLKCSRRRMQSFFDCDGGATRREKLLSCRRRETTDVFLMHHPALGASIEKRFISESLWERKDDGSSYVVVEQQKGGDGASTRRRTKEKAKLLKRNLKKFATTFVSAQALQGSIPQTKIMMKFMPEDSHLHLHQEEQALAAARILSEMRRYFDKSAEIDRGRRGTFGVIMKANKEAYDDDETKMLAEGTAMFEIFQTLPSKFILLSTPITTGKIAFKRGDPNAWGWSSGIVRADASEITSYLWDPLRRAGRRHDDLEKRIVEERNEHHRLVYNWKKTAKVIGDRDFLARAIWKKTDTENFVVVVFPAESPKCPPRHGVIRAKYPSVTRISSTEKNMCLVETLIHPDWGGAMSPVLTNLYSNRNLSRVTEVQQYFAGLRRLEVYDEKDGVAVGENFMLRIKEERDTMSAERKHQTRVATVVNNHAGLKEFVAKYSWFPSLVEAMLSNWLRDPRKVQSKVDNLSKKEATKIGHSLSAILRVRKVPQVGVDVWVREYPALVELAKRERFFVPMAVIIGQRKIDKALWGMAWKVGFGATLGVLDVATDIFAIANFTMQGNHRYASAVIASVSVSMATQAFCIYVMKKKRGVLVVSKEFFFLFTGLKPAIDAFRVLSGTKARTGDLFDPLTELLSFKMIEIVAEAIPSSLVQIYAMLSSSGHQSSGSSISILVSIVTISLGAVTIAFDLDSDPDRRMHSPDFYGYVPSTSGQRTVVFFSMFFFTACHIMVRMLGFVLLALVSPALAQAVFLGDICFFLLLKALSGDLRYWVPLSAVPSWTVSIMTRMFGKIMVDFTASLHFRHAQEVGGLYWSLCLVLGQMTSFVAVQLYSRMPEATSSNDLWAFMGALETAFVICFAIFFASIKQKYRATFFSTTTAKQFRIKDFREAKSDFARSNILKLHPSYYKSVRGEVEQWVRENYETWIEEKPDWFTERARKKIPKDMIPT